MNHDRVHKFDAWMKGLHGSAAAKQRLMAFLTMLSGQQTPAMAAMSLGVSERRFRALRAGLLQAALTDLEPRPVGRPSVHATGTESARLVEMQDNIRDLRIDLRAAQIREEIALAMPHLFRRKRRTKKRAKRHHRKITTTGKNNTSNS